MSMPIERLPRFSARNNERPVRSSVSSPALSFSRAPCWRTSSPAPGRSTLITSAPKSASICVTQGPEMIRLRSSTRMLASSPVLPAFDDDAADAFIG